MLKLYKIKNKITGEFMTDRFLDTRRGGGKEFSSVGAMFTESELASVLDAYYVTKIPSPKAKRDEHFNIVKDSKGNYVYLPSKPSKPIAKRLFSLEIIEYEVTESGSSPAIGCLPEKASEKLYNAFDPVDILKMREWID